MNKHIVKHIVKGIGLSAGFGESCLSLGFREASWSAERARYNQVEPTR
jgi:hypothetical protein